MALPVLPSGFMTILEKGKVPGSSSDPPTPMIMGLTLVVGLCEYYPRLIGFLERAIRLIQASSRLPLQAQGRLELPDLLIRQASQS